MKSELYTKSLNNDLKKFGYEESIAGEDDFNLAVKSLEYSFTMRRGLFISGTTGCGKTTFARAIRAILQSATFIDCSNPQQIMNLASQQLQRDLCSSHLVIDDVGAEVLYNEFGVARNLITELIAQFYARDSRYMLYITSNLNGEEFIKRYGARIFSRIKEMCAFVKFTGDDKRKVMVIK